MKKKVIALAVTAVLAVGLLAACGSNSSSSSNNSGSSSSKDEAVSAQQESTSASEESSDISASRKAEKDRKTLIVGFDANYPPYGYMGDDGEYTGFDLELAQDVCDMEGWTLKKQPINWDSKDMELNSGNIDCIWNGFTMNGREGKYTFSEPYVNNTQVIAVKTDSGIDKLSDLKGKTVGVQKASAALDVLEGDQKDLSDTFKKLEQFSDYNVAFTELEASSLDALAIDVGVANYQIQSRGADKYKVLDENLNSEQYAVAFKKGNTTLRDVVQDDLNKLAKDGTVTKLAKKYDISDMVILGNENTDDAEK